MSISLTIPTSELVKFSPQFRNELCSYILKQGGDMAEIKPDAAVNGKEGLSRLSITDAKLFLNNCSEKTIAVLKYIVENDGDFLQSGAFKATGYDDLRAVWAGLTRRTRSITSKGDALLLNFFKVGDDDWRGVMASQTVSSMKVALNDQT